MAFTREFVLKAGVSEDMVDDVMKEHGIAVQKAKDTLRAAANGDNESNSAEIERLRKEIADKDNTIETLKGDIASVKLSSKIEAALLKAGARNLKACKALIDEDSVSIDNKGNLKGLEEQLKELRSGDDTSFLFEQNKSKQADVGDSKNAEQAESNADTEKKESGYKPKSGESAEVKGIGAQIAAEKAQAAKEAKSENAEGSLWA